MEPRYARGIDQNSFAEDLDLQSQADELRTRLKSIPSDLEALVGLGDIAAAQHMWTESIQLYRQSLRLGGESPELLNSLGCVYAQIDDWENAVRCFQRGVTRFPNSSLCYVSLAYKENLEGRSNASEQLYLQAINLSTDPKEAQYNLAALYREGGQLDKAIDLYQKLIKDYPHDATLHDGLGRAWLQRGDWTEGWEKYEYRFQVAGLPSFNPKFNCPGWRGETLCDSHLLIVAEQGIGDEIQAASCYAEAVGASRQCTITCDPRLESVFQNSFADAQIVPVATLDRGDWVPDASENFDYQVSSASLYQHFRPTVESCPGVPYLFMNELAASHQEPLETKLHSDRRLRVGLSWFGGTVDEQQRRRSIPSAQIGRLLSLQKVEWHCLQHGCQCHGDSKGIRSMPELFCVGDQLICDAELDPFTSLDDWFRLMKSLDLVISVDNSNIHFAGALGIPTWALLSESVNWRWPTDGAVCPWYQSVQLFHKKKFGSWGLLFDRIIEELQRSKLS